MACRNQRGFIVPGFGLPLRWQQFGNPASEVGGGLFAHDNTTFLKTALDATMIPISCYTLRERTMIALINEFTDIPDWNNLIYDAAKLETWKYTKLHDGRDITQNMINYCIDEIKYYVPQWYASHIYPALDGGVYKSNSLISPAIKGYLRSAVSLLERDESLLTASKINDDDTLRRLVDPYLFPLSFTTTRVLRGGSIRRDECISRCGEGRVWRTPSPEECVLEGRGNYANDMAWSRFFQWLPFDVVFESGGIGKTAISSYVNNVHPVAHRALYDVLEMFIDAILPCFNRSILELKYPRWLEPRHLPLDTIDSTIIQRDVGHFCPPEWRSSRARQGDKSNFARPELVDLKRDFWDVGIQLVSEVSSIELSPEQPEFEDEKWHINGQLNERIVTTVVYCFDSENVIGGSVAFRRAVTTDQAQLVALEAGNIEVATDIFGVKEDDPAVQEIGRVSVEENRLISFPNIFQTKLQGFRLYDKSRSGHCKLLKLYLVDPNRRIMSTAMVPCQRRDWRVEELRSQAHSSHGSSPEPSDQATDMSDEYSISLETAKSMRKDFVEERNKFNQKHTQAFLDYTRFQFEDIVDQTEWDMCRDEIPKIA